MKRPASSSQSFQPKGDVVSSRLRARRRAGIPLTLPPTSRGGSPLCHRALLPTEHVADPQLSGGLLPRRAERRRAGQRVRVTLGVKGEGTSEKG